MDQAAFAAYIKDGLRLLDVGQEEDLASRDRKTLKIEAIFAQISENE